MGKVLDQVSNAGPAESEISEELLHADVDGITPPIVCDLALARCEHTVKAYEPSLMDWDVGKVLRQSVTSCWAKAVQLRLTKLGVFLVVVPLVDAHLMAVEHLEESERLDAGLIEGLGEVLWISTQPVINTLEHQGAAVYSSPHHGLKQLGPRTELLQLLACAFGRARE